MDRSAPFAEPSAGLGRGAVGESEASQSDVADMIHGVFDTRRYVRIDNVPGHSNHEQITESLIEQKLGT